MGVRHHDYLSIVSRSHLPRNSSHYQCHVNKDEVAPSILAPAPSPVHATERTTTSAVARRTSHVARRRSLLLTLRDNLQSCTTPTAAHNPTDVHITHVLVQSQPPHLQPDAPFPFSPSVNQGPDPDWLPTAPKEGSLHLSKHCAVPPCGACYSRPDPFPFARQFLGKSSRFHWITVLTATLNHHQPTSFP